MLIKNSILRPKHHRTSRCEKVYITATAVSAAGKELDFTATCEVKIEASAAGEAPKTPTFHMLANTGVSMRLAGFEDPVIVDIKGAFFAKDRPPIIMDHDTKKRLGFS